MKSVRCQKLSIDHAEYSLVTNRRYSPDADKWLGARERIDDELERLLLASSKAPVDDVAELASIFRLIKYETRTLADFKEEILRAARQFGILDDEIDARIDALIGFLLRKAADHGSRIVRIEELHKAFTGYDTPYRLLSPESVQVRIADVEHYKCGETDGRHTIPRTASDDILRSVLQHPLTVVIGDGGAGKTVAACDAVARGHLETSTPPGFGLIVRAPDANSQTLIEKIARWRHLVRWNDGLGLKVSFQRLRLAFSGNPLLVVCIDAIDEKPERARLPAEAQQLVRQLLDDAIDEQQRFGMPVISIVLTCRRPEELHELLCSGFEFSQSYNRIDVSDFDEDELISLAGELDGDVGQRLTGHCQMRTVESERMHSHDGRAVSEDIMKSIRHPVLWRFFSDLDVSDQHACLDGSNDGFDQLAGAYLQWFRRKA